MGRTPKRVAKTVLTISSTETSAESLSKESEQGMDKDSELAVDKGSELGIDKGQEELPLDDDNATEVEKECENAADMEVELLFAIPTADYADVGPDGDHVHNQLYLVVYKGLPLTFSVWLKPCDESEDGSRVISIGYELLTKGLSLTTIVRKIVGSYNYSKTVVRELTDMVEHEGEAVCWELNGFPAPASGDTTLVGSILFCQRVRTTSVSSALKGSGGVELRCSERQSLIVPHSYGLLNRAFPFLSAFFKGDKHTVFYDLKEFSVQAVEYVIRAIMSQESDDSDTNGLQDLDNQDMTDVAKLFKLALKESQAQFHIQLIEKSRVGALLRELGTVTVGRLVEEAEFAKEAGFNVLLSVAIAAFDEADVPGWIHNQSMEYAVMAHRTRILG